MRGTMEDAVTEVKQAAEVVQTRGIDSAILKSGNPRGEFVWKDGNGFLMGNCNLI